MKQIDQLTKPASEKGSSHLLFLLKISSVLWIVWGVAHVVFGVFGLSGFLFGDVAETMKAMAGGADPATLEVDYPEAVVAILNQHSWNLLWFGVFTTVGGVLIWKHSAIAIVMTAIVGGLADAGYFLFVDLAGFAAAPGPQLTWISATAIILSIIVYVRTKAMTAI